MHRTFNSISIISILTSIFLNEVAADCAADDQCGRASTIELRCERPGTNATQCICVGDKTFDTDALNCVMCWAQYTVPPYELGVALDYQSKISCGPRAPSTSTTLNECDWTCRVAWQVGNTCGSYDSDATTCICRYKFIWQSWIDDVGNCAGCIEKHGDTALANRLRAWYNFDCATATGIGQGGGKTLNGGTVVFIPAVQLFLISTAVMMWEGLRMSW
ncbi:hypothetical protein B0T22DRAFT_478513 [Podospora appendiculata]|uniref:Uncharacterized protein n=1 Tax=Podospora appendiculata TaxID=314037 RepID=A0AAE1CB76_9PEZI|nr:hypothetical protein B0T22DRAFT_478513 [Podospora appendiculata]